MRIPVPKDLKKRQSAADSETSFSIPLQTVTPILGGAPKTRTVDTVDVIRVPSIRGQLRFWWRALYAHHFTSSAELFTAEKAIWGGVFGENEHGDRVTRSPVALSVDVEKRERQPYPVDQHAASRSDDFRPNEIGAYALFTRRGKETEESSNAYKAWKRSGRVGQEPNPIWDSNQLISQQWTSDINFVLRGNFREFVGDSKTLSGVAKQILQSKSTPTQQEVTAAFRQSVRNAIKAWILFGGVGGRTRRGVGSLTVTGEKDAKEWLPTELSLEALKAHFGQDIFAATATAARDTASLSGASLFAGSPKKDAILVWTDALHWARDFRQQSGSAGTFAREAGSGSTPGQSRWPESDKVRRLLKPGGGWKHPPRLNASPVWPRATFGLPIVGQFEDRKDGPTFTIIWKPNGAPGVDRLASPLILKPVALRSGTFVPVALWLTRAFPDGQVGLSNGQQGNQLALRQGSSAPFDEVTANGDSAMYQPLADVEHLPRGERVKTAFLAWIEKQGAKRIV